MSTQPFRRIDERGAANRLLSRRLRACLAIAGHAFLLDEVLPRILLGAVDDTYRIFSTEWKRFEDARRSIEEYLATGRILTHMNIEDAPLSWSTELEPLTLLQYLLIFHRRAFLFLAFVPEERAEDYLLDRNPLVRALAKWRYRSCAGWLTAMR